MGNYATTSDLSERFESDEHLAHLTDTAESGASDADRLGEAIDHAEGEMNSYIGMRYRVPVDVASDSVLAAFLLSMCLDFAIWFLGSRPGFEVSDDMERAYRLRVEWLEKLAAGKVVLPATATPLSTGSKDPVAAWGTAGTTEDSKRVFTRDRHKEL